MAALALAGHILLWLLAVLLVLLAIALLAPVSVWLTYEKGEFSLKAGMLFVKIPLLPRRPLTEEQKKRREKKAARKAARRAAKAQKPEEPAKKRPPKEKAKLTLDAVCKLVGAAGRLLRAVLGALRIRHIRIRFAVSGSDAAATAIQYGQVNAWLHTSLAFLNRVLWLEFDEMRVEPDFTGGLEGSEHFSCQISARLIIMVIAGAAFVYTLFKEKLLDLFL